MLAGFQWVADGRLYGYSMAFSAFVFIVCGIEMTSRFFKRHAPTDAVTFHDYSWTRIALPVARQMVSIINAATLEKVSQGWANILYSLAGAGIFFLFSVISIQLGLLARNAVKVENCNKLASLRKPV